MSSWASTTTRGPVTHTVDVGKVNPITCDAERNANHREAGYTFDPDIGKSDATLAMEQAPRYPTRASSVSACYWEPHPASPAPMPFHGP